MHTLILLGMTGRKSVKEDTVFLVELKESYQEVVFNATSSVDHSSHHKECLSGLPESWTMYHASHLIYQNTYNRCIDLLTWFHRSHTGKFNLPMNMNKLCCNMLFSNPVFPWGFCTCYQEHLTKTSVTASTDVMNMHNDSTNQM